MGVITIKPDSVLNNYLVAKTNVTKYNQQLKPVGVFKPGDTVGKVFSYITKPSFHWEFKEQNGQSYFTKHAPGFYEKPIDVVKAEIQSAQSIEDVKKDEMGAVSYYVSKYAKPVGLVILASVTLHALITKKWD